MEGIYAIYFTGMAGLGHAVFVMKNGIVSGADAMGVMFDGTYRDVGADTLDFSVTMTVPPGPPLVTGVTAEREPLVQEIAAKLPHNFGNGNPIGIDTPTGPVNAVFRKLRSIP